MIQRYRMHNISNNYINIIELLEDYADECNLEIEINRIKGFFTSDYNIKIKGNERDIINLEDKCIIDLKKYK